MEILAAVGDLHCNSRQGLMPPKVDLNEGITAHASEKQLWIWDKWLDYWERVAKIKRKKGARVIALINGETCDVNKHNSTELVSTDPSDAIRMALEALKPTSGIVDAYVVSYGTEAHVGQNGLLDRVVSDRLWGKVIGGHWNRFAVGDMRVDAMHHPKMNTRMHWTRGGAALRMSVELEIDYYRMGWPLPHVAIRGHVHQPQDSGDNHPIRTFILPSWKLSDSFVSRIGEAFPAPIGGAIYWIKPGKSRVRYERMYHEWPITASDPYQKVLN